MYNIKHKRTLASTQDYFLNKRVSDIEEWNTVYADYQTAGRGQKGNCWESRKGENLTFSLCLKPVKIYAHNQFILTQIISLALYDYFASYCHNVSIKWANDIYINEKKVSGMLIQNKLSNNNILLSICGIGINLNQTEFLLNPNATSLGLQTKQKFVVRAELVKVLNCIRERYENIEHGLTEDYKAEYLSHLLYFDIMRDYFYQNHRIKAKICDVNEYGHLVLTAKDGKTITCDLKEIVF